MEQRCGDKRCGLQRGPIWSLIKLQACQPLVNPYVSEFTLRAITRSSVLDASHRCDPLLICVLHKFHFGDRVGDVDQALRCTSAGHDHVGLR